MGQNIKLAHAQSLWRPEESPCDLWPLAELVAVGK